MFECVCVLQFAACRVEDQAGNAAEGVSSLVVGGCKRAKLASVQDLKCKSEVEVK